MRLKLSSKRGQNTLEYALLIAAVVAGIVATQHYVQRGFQGRLKESTDTLGEQFQAGTFSSNWTTSQSGTTRDLVGKETGNTSKPGQTKTVFRTHQTNDRWGNDQVSGNPYQ